MSGEDKLSLPAYSGHCMIRRKKEERLGVRIFRFCSYMLPFFFDFFFLAFVGLFTRLNIRNGLCLRILLFFRKPILSNRFSGADHFSVPTLRSLAEFSSLRYYRIVHHFPCLGADPGMIFLVIQFSCSCSWELVAAQLVNILGVPRLLLARNSSNILSGDSSYLEYSE